MEIATARFGIVEVDEKKVISFRDGVPGLEDYKQYVILNSQESYPVVWMQSIEEPEVCLPVLDTFSAVPDYAFNISDEEATELDLSGPEALHVMSVAVIPENVEGMTINLAAPIIVNMETGQAKQIILGGGEYNVRYPIFADLCRLIKEGEADAGAVQEN